MSIDSPLGPVRVIEIDGAIADIKFAMSPRQDNTPLLSRAAEQLADYFAGERQSFDLPLAPPHSTFQARVRDAMLAIPYGETRSYGELAAKTGSAARAVGQGCGSNPIPIVVPCHRVLAAGGKIGGFSARGGVTTKRWLLAHEAPAAPQGDLFSQSR